MNGVQDRCAGVAEAVPQQPLCLAGQPRSIECAIAITTWTIGRRRERGPIAQEDFHARRASLRVAAVEPGIVDDFYPTGQSKDLR